MMTCGTNWKCTKIKMGPEGIVVPEEIQTDVEKARQYIFEQLELRKAAETAKPTNQTDYSGVPHSSFDDHKLDNSVLEEVVGNSNSGTQGLKDWQEYENSQEPQTEIPHPNLSGSQTNKNNLEELIKNERENYSANDGSNPGDNSGGVKEETPKQETFRKKDSPSAAKEGNVSENASLPEDQKRGFWKGMWDRKHILNPGRSIRGYAIVAGIVLSLYGGYSLFSGEDSSKKSGTAQASALGGGSSADGEKARRIRSENPAPRIEKSPLEYKIEKTPLSKSLKEATRSENYLDGKILEGEGKIKFDGIVNGHQVSYVEEDGENSMVAMINGKKYTFYDLEGGVSIKSPEYTFMNDGIERIVREGSRKDVLNSYEGNFNSNSGASIRKTFDKSNEFYNKIRKEIKENL